MQKFRKSGMKKQKDKANTPNLFCLMLKVAFIQNLQIIYYIQELSNSLKKKKRKRKYMNVPDVTKILFQNTIT